MSVPLKLLSTFLISLLIFLNGCGLYYDYKNTDSSKDNSTSGNQSEPDGGILVKEVLDGDTIILSDGNRVRLIGINAPEYGMYFFEEAGDVLEIMILGREVVLEKDVSETDKYGRLLRYVYADSLFINLEMVKRGFASCYTYPPDVKYNELFLEAERYARKNNLGLWRSSEIDNIKVELHYDAAGNDNTNLNDEYVLIKNKGTESVNIYGWTVKDSGTCIYKFGSYIFRPDTTIYLFTGSGKDGQGKFYCGSTGPIWNNDHDTLYLRDREGLLLEIYNY